MSRDTELMNIVYTHNSATTVALLSFALWFRFTPIYVYMQKMSDLYLAFTITYGAYSLARDNANIIFARRFTPSLDFSCQA